MDLEQIERILSMLKNNDVTDFELTQDGTQIKLSRSSPTITFAQGEAHRAISLEPAIATRAASGIVPDGVVSERTDLLKVESPLVGTFYGRPSPDAEPFVSQGKTVKKGDTLCIIEAMKLMNEIEAPYSGKIEKILVQDAEVVEFGETMFLINPNG